MIIKFPKGEIKIDGNAKISDFRMNLAKENHQARIKFNLLGDDEEIPLDIVIMKYNYPSIKGISSIQVQIQGYEMNNEIEFDLVATYQWMKGIFNLKGHIKNNQINQNIEDAQQVINLIYQAIVF